ncbi:DNA-binding protein [Citrobacter amalonaticus]|uniref:DNA-binding protein n=1 Tax=Citrobacter amalonaticus TaxID=35703 RepID=UPI0012D4B66F|nr:DNA-binding protein [Citrobacter amalonaticus]
MICPKDTSLNQTRPACRYASTSAAAPCPTSPPVMREFRTRQRDLASEQTPALPPELAQLLTGQLALLWQAA